MQTSDSNGPSVEVIHGIEERLVAEGLLTIETLDVIRPFWTTKYAFVNEWQAPKPRAKGGTRFFGAHVAFDQSVGDWVASLTVLAKGQQSHIFDALRSLRTVRGTTDIMLFILPYVVQNVLCSGNEDAADSLYKELMAALEATWGSGGGSTDGRSGARSSRGRGGGTHSNGGTGSSSRGSRVHLSAQTMFVLVDTLQAWQRNKVAAEHLHVASASARSGSRRAPSRPMYR